MFSGIFNQSCIMCKQYSRQVICNVCMADCKEVLSKPPSTTHPVIVDIQSRAKAQKLITLGWYDWPVSTLIHYIKFKQRPRFCHLLSQCFVKYALQNIVLPDAVIGMPTHFWKMYLRGYNPATIFAKLIANELNLQDASRYMKMGLSFKDQRHLDRSDRISRQRKFYCKVLPPNIKHVALIDDVATTGATLGSAIDAIKKANPDIDVSAWCIGATKPTQN